MRIRLKPTKKELRKAHHKQQKIEALLDGKIVELPIKEIPEYQRFLKGYELTTFISIPDQLGVSWVIAKKKRRKRTTPEQIIKLES